MYNEVFTTLEIRIEPLFIECHSEKSNVGENSIFEIMCSGNETKDVAQAMGISESTIYRAKRNLRTCGGVEGKKVKRGWKPKNYPTNN